MKGTLRGIVIGSACSMLVLVVATAVAGTGVGSLFNLGQTNTVDAQSILTGNAGAAAQFRVENTGGGPALSLLVNSGVTPLKVTSSTKVDNLNADKLDGIDSTAFLPASAVVRVGPVNVSPSSFGNSSSVATIGQLSFTGDCALDTVSGTQSVELVIQSSANHGAFAVVSQPGVVTFTDGAVADMSANSPYLLARQDASSGAPIFRSATGTARSADGHEYIYNLYMVQNAQGATNGHCLFGGSIMR